MLAVTVAVIGRLFGILELFVLGAGLAALVAAAVLWVHLRRIDLDVHRTSSPAALQVGDIGRVELRITNRAARGTGPLQLWEPVSGIGGATLRLAPMRAKESVTAHYRLPASRRGTVRFGPLTAERRDPFGLSSRRTTIGGTDDITVLPAHLPLSLPIGTGGTGPIGQHLRMRALGRSGIEFHSFRDYVEGDDLRQINWRASARSETLKVRQVEPDGLRRCTVTLDTSSDQYIAESTSEPGGPTDRSRARRNHTAGEQDGFERAVSAAASAIAAADRSGLLLRMLIGDSVDLRNATLGAALYRLADCTTSDPATPSFTAPAGEGLGLQIVVSGSAGSPAVVAARRQLSPNDVLVVIACTSMSRPSGMFVIDATSDTEFARSWAAMTGTADLVSSSYPPRSSVRTAS